MKERNLCAFFLLESNIWILYFKLHLFWLNLLKRRHKYHWIVPIAIYCHQCRMVDTSSKYINSIRNKTNVIRECVCVIFIFKLSFYSYDLYETETGVCIVQFPGDFILHKLLITFYSLQSVIRCKYKINQINELLGLKLPLN